MRILIAHPQMETYGGAETVIVHLARYLKAKNVEARILTLSTAPHSEYEGFDIVTPKESVSYKIRGGRLQHGLEILNLASTLKKLVKQHVDYCDIINVHNFPSTWAAPDSRKAVWQCNEFPDLWHSYKPSFWLKTLVALGRKYDKHLVRKNVSAAIVPDAIQQAKFLERYGFKPEIIPYGIESDLFSAKVNSRFNLGLDGRFVVLHVGMVSPSKNQFASIQAVGKLKREIPRVKLVLAGYHETNDYFNMLQQYIKEKNLENHVVFTGHITKNQLKELYHLCHVFVCPVKGQGSWLSPFEALSVGKPIIVSQSLSCSDLIRKEKIGLVLSNSSMLAPAILEVHQLYETYVDMALRGKKFVKENLTWNNYCEQVFRLFQKF